MHLTFALFFPWGLRAADMNKVYETQEERYIKEVNIDTKFEVIALHGLFNGLCITRHESSDVAFSKGSLWDSGN